MRGSCSGRRSRFGVALVVVLTIVSLGASAVTAKPEHEGDDWGSVPAFLARPDGPTGPLTGYDTATGEKRFSLPAGLLTADGTRYFAAVPVDTGTAIEVYEPQLGTLMERFVIDGAWEIRGVSASGAWLGLRRIPTKAEFAGWQAGEDRQTEIAIMDTVSSRITDEIRLDGNFDVDGLSARGDALFLIQHVSADDGEHYLIRLYDLKADLLQEAPLRDKREPDEEMTGEAWDGAASADGQWLLTLYLNTKEEHAFVHSLNLENRYPVCIDLPSGDGDMTKLRSYTITLAPNGLIAYAANPVLGRLAVLDLSSWRVSHFVAFPAVTPTTTTERPSARSLLSADGRTLYFTAGHVLWTYDTVAGTIGNSYLAPATVTGMGLSAKGDRLLMADSEGKVTAVDLQSGELIALASA